MDESEIMVLTVMHGRRARLIREIEPERAGSLAGGPMAGRPNVQPDGSTGAPS